MPAKASADESCVGFFGFGIDCAPAASPFACRITCSPPSSVQPAIPASHGQILPTSSGAAKPISAIMRSGSTPQASRITEPAIGTMPSSRARRAAPKVAAVLETSPPRSPVASVPARAPSSVCAM